MNDEKVEEVVEKKEPVVEVAKVDEETLKRSGEKEQAANSDGMSVVKEKVVEKDVVPSFFVDKSDRHKVEVDILTSKLDGRMMSISRVGLGLDFVKDFHYLRHTVLWFEFSLPNYEDMTTYRQRSATWRKDAQQVIVDKLSLRNFLLAWHLKSWNVTDRNGVVVPLEHEENGMLTDESLAKVYATTTTLLDVVLTILEKDTLIS